MFEKPTPGTFDYWWWYQGGQQIGQFIFFIISVILALLVIGWFLNQFDTEEEAARRDEFIATHPNRPCVRCDRRCGKWDCKWHVAMTKTEWAAHSLMFGIMMDQADELTGRKKTRNIRSGLR